MKKNHIFSYAPISLLIQVAIILLSVVGCAPMTSDFYRPEAPEGRVVQAHCPPVNSFILFEKNKVIIGAKASRTTDNQISITVTFEVPQGRVAILKEQNLEVLLEGKTPSRHNLSGHKWVSLGRTAEIPPNQPMVGKTEKTFFFEQITLYGTTEHAYFIFTTTLDIHNPAVIEIRLPSILINDVEVEIPVIKFIHDNESYIGSLNC